MIAFFPQPIPVVIEERGAPVRDALAIGMSVVVGPGTSVVVLIDGHLDWIPQSRVNFGAFDRYRSRR